MRQITTLAFVLLFNLPCSAQIKFEKGYFIDNDGSRHDCLIRNAGWKNNPKRFEYRNSVGDAPTEIDISRVQEFGLNDVVTYVRSIVKIDRSGTELTELSASRDPLWSEEQLFLKILTMGKVSLYVYQHENLTRFFYALDESPIRQLIFKKYIKDYSVITNNDFRQQLWAGLKCDEKLSNSAKHLPYRESALLKYFRSYNECHGETQDGIADERIKSRPKGMFHLRLTSGVGLASLRLQNSEDFRYGDLTFIGSPTLRAGAEMEFVLPYNRNKWALVFEPGFQYFRGEQSGAAAGTAIVQYQSLELPVGARHYFFLTGQNKLFVDAFVGVGISINSSFSFQKDPLPKEIVQRVNPAIGVGYGFNNWSVEFRYNINRNITGDYIYWKSRYNLASVIIGFRVF